MLEAYCGPKGWVWLTELASRVARQQATKLLHYLNWGCIRPCSSCIPINEGSVTTMYYTLTYSDKQRMLLILDEPPVEYWQVLAEQRRQALADTLLENEEV